jgi:hypothetical protein
VEIYLPAEPLKEAKYTITEFTMTQRKKLSEFAGLELDLPKFDLQAPDVDISHSEINHGDHNIESDDEGAMVKADLFKLAKYSVKLFKKIEDNDQFESWVQAKITKAADYISSVYHYLEYEMKFSEYGDKIEKSDMYSESEKRQMKNALMEARKSLAALKIDQADKLEKPKAVKEGIQHTCDACNGTGVVEKALPAGTKKKVKDYNRLLKATYAGHKRKDENENGIPDDEEGLEVGAMDDEIITKKEKIKSKSRPNKEESVTPVKKTRETETNPKSKNPSTSSSSTKKGNGDSFKKELDNAKSKSSSNSQDTGNPYASKKEAKTDESFYEAKPSAGLSADKKSAVAKKAQKGGDIGKPGKNFDKVAAKSGGGEKGKKIAAAAMWKNVKESVAYLEEKKAKKDYDKDGKIESEKDEHKGVVDNAIKSSKQEKECMSESIELRAILQNSGLVEATTETLQKAAPRRLEESCDLDRLKLLTERVIK